MHHQIQISPLGDSTAVVYPIVATTLVADANKNNKKASEVFQKFVQDNPVSSVPFDKLDIYIAGLLICVGFGVTKKEVTKEQMLAFAQNIKNPSATDEASKKEQIQKGIEEMELILGLRWSTTKKIAVGVGVVGIVAGGWYFWKKSQSN